MLKVCTAFSGYDSQCMALDELGVEYELVAWSEIDKFAIQAHNIIYPQWADRNYGDISKIDFGGVEDTLADMASYCIMTIMEMKSRECGTPCFYC